MKRAWISRISTVFLSMLVAGCGVASYEHRLEDQVNDLKYKQKLDTNLITAPTDPYKTLLIYLRPPKPMSKSPGFQPQTTPALWDVADTYSGAPQQDRAATATDPGTPVYPAVRLHVLGRIKKKPAAKKKGDAPAEPEVARGKFFDDVRTLLASEYGADPQQGAKADSKKKNHFNRLDITAANNGDAVKAYFYEDKATGTEVALIFDIPQAAIKSKMATQGIDLTLESMGVGTIANALFGGGTVSEAGGVKGAPAAGPAF